MNTDDLSIRRILLKLAQAMGLVKATLSISKSRIAALIYFRLGPLRKVWYANHETFSTGANRTEVIHAFLEDSKRKFHMATYVDWILGLEGSGILVRILTIEQPPGTPIENSVLWEIKRNLPFAISASHYSYKILNKEGERHTVLVTVLKKDFLDGITQLFEQSQFSLAEINLSSLQLSSLVSGRNYALLYQGSDYGFLTIVEGGKLKAFHINHDSNANRSFEGLQRQLIKYQEAVGKKAKNLPVFRFTADSHLPWLAGSQPQEVKEKAGLPVLAQGMPVEVKKELTTLSEIAPFSPDLLPGPLQKKQKKQRLLYKFAAFFLLFQLITPGIYFSIESKRSKLFSFTRKSELPQDIRKARDHLVQIQNVQKEIRMLVKYTIRTTRGQTKFLQTIANFTRPNMVLQRIVGQRRRLKLEGYALNVGIVSDLMQDLEDQFEGGKLSMKSEQKGEAIYFTITWVKPKRRQS